MYVIGTLCALCVGWTKTVCWRKGLRRTIWRDFQASGQTGVPCILFLCFMKLAALLSLNTAISLNDDAILIPLINQHRMFGWWELYLLKGSSMFQSLKDHEKYITSMSRKKALFSVYLGLPGRIPQTQFHIHIFTCMAKTMHSSALQSALSAR